MVPGCKGATVGMISGCSYCIATERAVTAASRTARVQELRGEAFADGSPNFGCE